MFTGIIEEVGKIISITKDSIIIKASAVLDGTKVGDSISVNGVCLTVTNFSSQDFSANVSSETFAVSSLGRLKSGDYVNLERALLINERLGGHIVTGHIDGTATVTEIKNQSGFYTLELKLNDENSKYVVKKGSIAVNGISLTIADVQKNKIRIAIIPHTYENTSLKALTSGTIVNIETDIIAKYVEKFLSTRDNNSGIDMKFLIENGF